MNAPLHLFCVPYAGGSAAAIYSRWSKHLAAHVRLHALELPGRGRRMPEPLVDTMDILVADLLRQILPIVRSGQPYAFYGHSMGTAIVYELLRALDLAGLPPAQTLYLSGRQPPHRPYAHRHLHILADQVFLEEIRKLGGTPDEFFRMEDLVRAMLPIIRNDYRMIELYTPAPAMHVTTAEIVFLSSDRDPLVDEEGARAWAAYTSAAFALRAFQGGHFFIHDEYPRICGLIASAQGKMVA